MLIKGDFSFQNMAGTVFKSSWYPATARVVLGRQLLQLNIIICFLGQY